MSVITQPRWGIAGRRSSHPAVTSLSLSESLGAANPVSLYLLPAGVRQILVRELLGLDLPEWMAMGQVNHTLPAESAGSRESFRRVSSASRRYAESAGVTHAYSRGSTHRRTLSDILGLDEDPTAETPPPVESTGSVAYAHAYTPGGHEFAEYVPGGYYAEAYTPGLQTAHVNE